jgi:hypothetical protein
VHAQVAVGDDLVIRIAVSMDGLNTSTRLRAIMALRRRLISSSLLPENMGPQITSIHPTLPVMISIRTV